MNFCDKFLSIKKGDKVYSLIHNQNLEVECDRFLKIGIVWLKMHSKTYPHTIKMIAFNRN